MYKLLLIFKYLRRKLVPLFAAAAVTMCTAMVIVVISIMGGFLEQWRDSAKKLTGDVVIETPSPDGFPLYDELIAELLEHEEIAAATPIVRTVGLLKIGEDVHYVLVEGVDPKSLDKVVEFGSALYWTKERLEAERKRFQHKQGIAKFRWDDVAGVDLKELGMSLTPPDKWITRPENAPDADPDENDSSQAPKRKMSGMVMGIEVDPFNNRDVEGQFRFHYNRTVGSTITLTVVPLTSKGGLLEPELREFKVVNEFKTGLYDRDKQQVFVPFKDLQDMMYMSETEETDREGNVIGKVPARATQVAVRGKPGVDLNQLAVLVDNTVTKFYLDRRYFGRPMVRTWQQLHAQALGAVQKEKGLLTFLFGVISLVAVVLILVIFYMIVLEKTRDIGTLRALGASQLGIASIFLGYAKVIGILGAALGTVIAYYIVTYLNEIHDWLGDGLGVFVFFIGVPCLGLIGSSIVLHICRLIRHEFRVRRPMVAVHATWIGLGLGVCLSIGDIGRQLLFTERREFETGPLLVQYAILWGAITAFFLWVALEYLVADALLKQRTQRIKLSAVAAVNTLICLAVVGVCFATVKNLAETLNTHISVTIWDRRIYFFDVIPNKVDWVEVSVVVVAAVAASVVGALIPALKGACVDPIESLRYE